jgi:hypothetical protein
LICRGWIKFHTYIYVGSILQPHARYIIALGEASNVLLILPQFLEQIFQHEILWDVRFS